jgi:hypothetical protein
MASSNERAYTPPNRYGDDDAEQNRLYCGPRRTVGVFLADSPRNDGHGADAQAHRHGVQQHQHRLGQGDRCHGIGAQSGDEEHIHHGEDRFETELEHHRNR